VWESRVGGLKIGFLLAVLDALNSRFKDKLSNFKNDNIADTRHTV